MPKEAENVTYPFIENKPVREMEDLNPLNKIDTKFFQQGAVKNPQIQIESRAFRAVVSATPTDKADTTDIQYAIDKANDAGGGVVFLLTGTHKVTKDITLKENVTLLGEDREETIIDFVNTGSSLRAVVETGQNSISNIHLEGFTIRGRRVSTVDEGAIYLDTVLDSSIKNINFEDNYDVATGNGVDIAGSDGNNVGILIEGCRFKDSGNSISIDTLVYSWIRNNLFYDNTIEASSTVKSIVTQSWEGVWIENNLFYELSGICIDTTGDTFDKGFIINNHMMRCEGTQAIDFAGGGSTISGNTMFGHTVLSGGGIKMTASSYCTLTGNYIDNFNNDGILLNTSCDQNAVTGNTSVGNGGYGVNINNAGCDQNVVVGNNLATNSTGGLNDLGTGTVATGNAT